MAKCTFRERPGMDELCGLLADPGKSMCPRHMFLDDQRRAAAALQAAAKPAPRVPLNPAMMGACGYAFVGSGICKKCRRTVWWYRNSATGNTSPWDPMPDETQRPVNHFATCPHAVEFRIRRSA
jgi:hypothetical protein